MSAPVSAWKAGTPGLVGPRRWWLRAGSHGLPYSNIGHVRLREEHDRVCNATAMPALFPAQQP